MARRRRKTFSCGHKGWGQFCHRCAQAKDLERWAEAKEADPDRIALTAPLGWPKDERGRPTPEEVRIEAERLRGGPSSL